MPTRSRAGPEITAQQQQQQQQQRQSPRSPLRLKTTACSESKSPHRSSFKLEEGRSPRSPLHENKKKQGPGTRVADLEAKLGAALDELKKLREQLETMEASKRSVEQELDEIKNRFPIAISDPLQEQEDKEEPSPPLLEPDPAIHHEESSPGDETTPVTDVFEVIRNPTDVIEEESNQLDASESPEISDLRSDLLERENEIQNLKNEITEVMASARKKEEEIGANLAAMGADLRESSAETARMGEKLEAAEAAKAAVEEEMRRLRVQNDQWKKAAEAAMVALEMDGRISTAERRGSVGGFEGFFVGMGSPMARRKVDEDFGGKRKGAGVGMFGDLWKKKGQHKV